MRNVARVMLLVGLVAMPVSVMAHGDGGGSAKMEPNAEKAKRYEGYAKGYDSQAKRYEEKAAKADGAESEYYRKMAANLKACAEQKRRMSKAYATGDRELLSAAGRRYSKLCQERGRLKSTRGKTDKRAVNKSKDTKWKSGKSKSVKSSGGNKDARDRQIEQMQKQIEQMQRQLEELKRDGAKKSDDFKF